MSKTWFTSDTHFGHSRIISLARRPFADVRDMDEVLIRNWNNVVQRNDVVWHAGDFAFGENAARIDEIFARLAGVKHLVIGNHDEGHEAVLTLPWASVGPLTSTLVDGQHVTLCHYPMKTWPKARKGAIHLYGHMHGRLRGTSRSLDIGVDAWNFWPISLNDIIRRLRTLPPDPDFRKDIDDETGSGAKM